MKLSQNTIVSVLLLLFLSGFYFPLKAEKDNFYIHYSSGNYTGAMATVYSDFLRTNDDAFRAVALLRIYEAARFPEDIPKAIEYLEKLSEKIDKKNNLELFSLRQSLLMKLYQNIDDSSKLFRIRKEAAFITEMQLLGPFEINGREDLTAINPALYESNHIPNHKYRGVDISWRKIFSDNDGVFRLDNYYNQTSKTGFVADAHFTTQKDSNYHLLLGSSGNIICEVNGEKVYESRESMEMFPSQIHVVLSLSRGSHSIRIKTKGNRSEVCSFSMQLFDESGNPLKSESEVVEKGELKNYSSSFGNCINYGTGFNEQYLQYMSGLNINTQVNVSNERSEEKVLSPYLLYYQALLESNPSLIEKKLRDGLALLPDNPLLLEQLAELKLKYNRLEESADIISRFEKYPQSPVGVILSIEFALKHDWYEEALTLCEKLSAIGYTYTADKFRVECWKGMGDPNKAFGALKLLFQHGVYSTYVHNEIYNAVSKGIRHNAAISLVDSVISKDQNNMKLRILLAECYLEKNDPYNAMANLIMVAKLSPCRDDVLFMIGRCYERMKKYDLSQYYFNQEKELNSSSELYSRALSMSEIFNENHYFQTVDIAYLIESSKRYKGEAAVCLLNQSCIDIASDGSYVQTGKKVFLINDEDHAKIEDETLILNKTDDTLIKMKFSVIDGLKKNETDNIMSSSVADPDNGLYYDLVKYKIDHPPCKNGNLVVYEYEYKSLAVLLDGNVCKNFYLDESMITMKERVLIRSNKKIKYKIYNWNTSTLTNKETADTVSIEIKDENVPASISEESMVPYRDRIPTVALTSFLSLEEFSSWYQNNINTKKGLSSQSKKEIDNICKGSSNDLDKVLRIYSYITSRIRYSGFEIGLGGYIPKKAEETFSSLNGDCKDIAFLMSEVFNYVGIKSDVALVRTSENGKLDKDFASVDSFNHALCRVDINGALYLDGTVKGHGIYDLPFEDRDIDALIITNAKAYYEKIDGNKYNKSHENIISSITVNDDLSAAVSVICKNKGLMSGVDTYNSVDRELVEEYWESLFKGSEIVSFQNKKNPQELETVTEYEIVIPQYALSLGSELYIPSLELSPDLYSRYASRSSRSSELFIRDDQVVESEIMVSFPQNCKIVKLLKNINVTNDRINYKREFQIITPSMIKIKTSLSVYKGVVKYNKYSEFKEYLRKLKQYEKEYVIVTKN